MTDKTEATRLADALERAVSQIDAEDQVASVARWFCEEAAALLRRWPDGEPMPWRPLAEEEIWASDAIMQENGRESGLLPELVALVRAVEAEIQARFAPPGQSERIAALEAENAEWKAKASTWLASPEAASRLQGYRELTERIAALEAENAALLSANRDNKAHFDALMADYQSQKSALREAREAMKHVLEDDGLIPRATSQCRQTVRTALARIDKVPGGGS